jgi:hypothetical protein
MGATLSFLSTLPEGEKSFALPPGEHGLAQPPGVINSMIITSIGERFYELSSRFMKFVVNMCSKVYLDFLEKCSIRSLDPDLKAEVLYLILCLIIFLFYLI